MTTKGTGRSKKKQIWSLLIDLYMHTHPSENISRFGILKLNIRSKRRKKDKPDSQTLDKEHEWNFWINNLQTLDGFSWQKEENGFLERER